MPTSFKPRPNTTTSRTRTHLLAAATAITLATGSSILPASLVPAPTAQACGTYGDPAIFGLATCDENELADHIQTLRSQGPSVMPMLTATHHDLLQKTAENCTPQQAKQQQQVREAIDQIAQQKDAWLSGLYWETDLNKAQTRAQNENKPLLVLCLLGNLDESLSCANSRLFRAVLYPNQAVQEKLANDFVLCWQSVRPAPVLTVDLGDGRRIERTITGNSMHFVLNAQGQVIDGMPGLVHPQTFAHWLNDAHSLWSGQTTPTKLFQFLNAKQAIDQLAVDPGLASQAAMRRARSKAFVEAGALDHLILQPSHMPTLAIEPLPREWMTNTNTTNANPFDFHVVSSKANTENFASTQEDFTQAIRSLGEVPLNPHIDTILSRETQDPALIHAMRRRLIQTTAMDTAINLWQLQPAFRQALMAGNEGPRDLATVTEWVYRDLFATPLNDPWMGMALQDTFTGLPTGGRQDLSTQTIDNQQTTAMMAQP